MQWMAAFFLSLGVLIWYLLPYQLSELTDEKSVVIDTLVQSNQKPTKLAAM